MTFYTYDAEGKLKTYTVPRPTSTPTATTWTSGPPALYPDGTSQSATYDAVGNTATALTRDNRIETLSYDTRNRNTGYSWSDGVGILINSVETLKFGY